jgi:quercetin dioxygenase-like cupin family protein
MKGEEIIVTESNYGKYIVTELKKDIQLPSFRPGEKLEEAKPGEERMMNHVIWMDSEVVPGSFYSECVWFFPGFLPPPEEMEKVSNGKGPQAHTHPFEEVLTFFGTNYDDPKDLGGEIEFWLEDEQFILDQSFLVYIPAGMKHCPLRIRRVDRPIFHFTLGPGQVYDGK